MENLFNHTLRKDKTFGYQPVKKVGDFLSVIQQEPHMKTSDSYSFIPTTKVLEVLADNGWMPTQIMETRAKDENKGFQKHLIRLSNEGLNYSLALREEYPEIVLQNSHDGKNSFQLSLGVYRLVCSNGLMVGDTYQSHRIHHIGFTADAVQSAINGITCFAPKVLNAISDFKAIELSPMEQTAFAESVIEMVFDEEKRQYVKPDTLLNYHRSADIGNDLWKTFNRVQENVIRGRFKFQDGFKRTKAREIKSIDKNVMINRGLWALTEKMAELKKSAN